MDTGAYGASDTLSVQHASLGGYMNSVHWGFVDDLPVQEPELLFTLCTGPRNFRVRIL